MSANLNLSVTAVSGSQNVAANTSQIDVLLSVTVSGSTYNQMMDDYGSITVDGTTINIGAVSVPRASTVTLYSARHTIAHGSDGTKTVGVSAAYYLNTSTYGWLNASASTALPAIARATVPSIGAVTLGSAVTINLPRASGAFTHNLSYAFGGASGTIAAGAGAAASWTPPLTLAHQIPNAVSGTGTIYCDTYNGSTLIGSKSIGFTAGVPASVGPAISAFTVAPVGAVFSGKYVKGISRVSYAVTASGAYGASVVSYAFSFGGLSAGSASGTTGTIPSAGSVVPTVSVKDSRGRTATAKLEAVTVYDYAVPTISAASAYRSNASGAADSDGAYIRALCSASCSGVGGANALTRRVRYKAAGGSYSGYSTLTENTALVIGGTLAATASYVAEISVADTAGNTRSIEFPIPTDAVTVNMRSGGKGIALGKYSEKDAFECAMPSEFTKEASFLSGLKIGSKTLADYIYPVGSVYISANATSPASLFGGTWEQTCKARGLAGAGTNVVNTSNNVGTYPAGTFTFGAGYRYGAGTHTLTANEMPAHSHVLNNGITGMWDNYINNSSGGYKHPGLDRASGIATPVSSGSYGGSAAHYIQSPVEVFYIWKRTA